MGSKNAGVGKGLIIILLGLVLVALKMNDGINSIVDWITLAMGIFLIIAGLIDLIRVPKGNNVSKTSKER